MHKSIFSLNNLKNLSIFPFAFIPMRGKFIVVNDKLPRPSVTEGPLLFAITLERQPMYATKSPYGLLNELSIKLNVGFNLFAATLIAS